MTRIYLAARYARHPEMQDYAHQLASQGYQVTATWVWGGHDVRAAQMGHASSEADALQAIWAAEDWADLQRADVCIAFTEGPNGPGRQRGGRHVELGAALAWDKRVIVVGPRENCFCWLPAVEWYADWAGCFAALCAAAARPRREAS